MACWLVDWEFKYCRLAFNADGLSSNDNTAQYPSNCKEVRVQGKNKHSSAKDDWCRYMHGPFQNVAKGQVTLTLNNLDNDKYISSLHGFMLLENGEEGPYG